MSNELYYRGSSSYEVAVKNRLSALESQGIMTTHAIRDMSAEVSGTIRQSTYAILASQESLRRTFVHGFNALNNNIMIGFDVMGAQLDAMSEAICSKLDAIHDILNNPLLTASRELYRRALTNYEKGYFEESLEDCKAAVEKNKTDFISWALLGQIYLFGAGKFSNVIDLDKAEDAFFTAAKYIDADIGHSDEANRLASEIYYYLGYTKLIKSNDLLVANNAEESNTKLIEAENSSKRAYTISKDNLIAGYEQAKELHFLGNDSEAMKILEEIIRADKNYALKASCDKNLESLWGKIDELIPRLRDEFVKELKELSVILTETLEQISCLEDYYKEKCEPILYELKNAKNVEDMDYFSVREAVATFYSQLTNEVKLITSEVDNDNTELVQFFDILVKALWSNKSIAGIGGTIGTIGNTVFRKGNVYTTTTNKAIYLFLCRKVCKFQLGEDSNNGPDLYFDALLEEKYEMEDEYYILPESVKRFFIMENYYNGYGGVSCHLMSYVQKLKDRADQCFPNSKNDKLHNVLAELNAAFDNLPEGTTSRKHGCYVATSVYGSYDCPQVWTLRRFRDYKLAETWYGRAFIHVYYAISPTIVKYFGETAWFKSLWRVKLDRMVKKLQNLGFADTPYNDREW